MNFQKYQANKIGVILLVVFAMAITAFAQEGPFSKQKDPIAKKTEVKPSMVYSKQSGDIPIAMSNNLYCAGYIQKASVDTRLEVVGADDEKDQHIYAEGDELYMNAGSNSGVKVGDMYSVIRPRGKVKSKFSKKKGLGIYVQELGAVEVLRVMGDVSVARVKTSCGVILFGDLLTKAETRVSPLFIERPALDRFAGSSGKASGSIVMARDGIELIAREQIVYIDLGREDNVRVGDYMTVYRPLGTGNLYETATLEHMDNKEEGFESDRYRGGRFSNMSPRKKGVDADGKVVTTENVKSRRAKGLRKVVGELVILNVLERTATAVVVRTASEIHTGDRVEVQ